MQLAYAGLAGRNHSGLLILNQKGGEQTPTGDYFPFNNTSNRMMLLAVCSTGLPCTSKMPAAEPSKSSSIRGHEAKHLMLPLHWKCGLSLRTTRGGECVPCSTLCQCWLGTVRPWRASVSACWAEEPGPGSVQKPSA